METILNKLIEEGLTARQIGEKIGRSRQQVHNLLKKFGLRTRRYNDHNPNVKARICRYCGKEKNIEEFPGAGFKKGIFYRRWKCSLCFTKSKEDYQQKIVAWFEEEKKKYSCDTCGINDFRVLDFHHKDDNKEFNVSEGAWRCSKNTILTEIAKCIPLCSNCHRILHYEERKRKGKVNE